MASSSQTEDCSICLSPLNEYIVLNCSHKFHRNCILQSINFKSNCPLCRSNISETVTNRIRTFTNSFISHLLRVMEDIPDNNIEGVHFLLQNGLNINIDIILSKNYDFFFKFVIIDNE